MRIQLDFDADGAQLVETLKKRTGLSTHKELFNNALALLDWATQKVMRGLVVGSMDERNKSYAELQMPALRHAARQAQDVGARTL